MPRDRFTLCRLSAPLDTPIPSTFGPFYCVWDDQEKVYVSKATACRMSGDLMLQEAIKHAEF